MTPTTAAAHVTFSRSERAILSAVGDAVIPAGDIVPTGGRPETVDRFERFLNEMDPRSVHGFRAALWSLQAFAMARTLRPFTRLDPVRRAELVRAWSTGTAVQRLSFRALTAPLKLIHFNDPELFEALDIPWLPPPGVPERNRWRSQIVTGDDLDPADTTLEVDVVVVGTGAGGAVVASELAARGHAVLMLEAGRYYDRHDFTTRDRVTLNQQMFAQSGMLATIGNAFIPLPVGRTVGGTTTLNSGTCFRTPDSLLNRWGSELGLTDLSPERMGPYFDRVERVLGVEEASWDHLGGIAEVIRDGCDALGYSHHPLRRNAPGCDGQGLCCFGCPTDAKRSTNVSYIPRALQSGAMCVSRARVERILLERGRAVGVAATLRLEDGSQRQLLVRARHVVVSCGSIYSPLLLLKSGLCNRWDQVGRHLTIHPAFGLNALFDREIRGWDGIPQGYCIDHFKGERILFEGAFVPLEFATAAFPVVGREFTNAMEAYSRMATFGFMISDSNTGRVRRGPGGRPMVTYNLGAEDVSRIRRGATILAEVFFAAGARRLYVPIAGHEVIEDQAGIERLRGARLRPWDFELSAYHPLGTCRMGVDPRTSVVDADHETHDVPNLFVVDGSSVPSALGVNPQITIMSLATRFADRLDARMSGAGRSARR